MERALGHTRSLAEHFKVAIEVIDQDAWSKLGVRLADSLEVFPPVRQNKNVGAPLRGFGV
jgi:hypothetical protein